MTVTAGIVEESSNVMGLKWEIGYELSKTYWGAGVFILSLKGCGCFPQAQMNICRDWASRAQAIAETKALEGRCVLACAVGTGRVTE